MAPATAKQRAADAKPKGNASAGIRGAYIFLVQMDIPKELEDDFNRLYDTEHIPLISKVPGVRHCERYVLETSENEHMPRYAAIFGLFTFASIGLPGLSGFIGEFLVVLGSFQYSGWVAAATMLVVIISAVYMLWMFQRVFFAVPSDWMRRFWPTLTDMSRNEWLALTPLILLVVGLGVLPGPVLDAISPSVQRILDVINASPGLTSFSLPW